MKVPDYLLNIEDLSTIEVKSDPVEKLQSERAIIHYISTKDLDRQREIVNPDGMDAKEFNKTAKSVWYNHNYKYDPNALPIGRNQWLKKKEDGILAKTEFASHSFADDIYRLHADGFISTWSIGIAPVKNEKGAIKEGSLEYDDKKNIVKWNEWRLMEYSSAPIPANVYAGDVLKSLINYELKSTEAKNMVENAYLKSVIEEQLKSFNSRLEEIYELVKNKSELDILSLIESNEREISEIKSKISELTKKLEKPEALGNPEQFKKISSEIIGDVLKKYKK
jgi:hypothetical protein